ncbi:MAG: type VII toxin-antitoxin system MntA family adenylyltransferase antitoxin [Myxococcota bacterium]
MEAASDQQAALRDRLSLALRGRSDVRLAVLFGSWARGTAGADSDVDLAVLGSGLDTLGLSSDLSAVVGREVDVVGLSDPSIPLLEELLRDGVPVYEATPGLFASWRTHTLLDMEWLRPWYRRMADAWLERVARDGV